jgi:hypothetical protein
MEGFNLLLDKKNEITVDINSSKTTYSSYIRSKV